MNKNIHRFCLAPLDTVSYANKILALFVLIANLGGWVPPFSEKLGFSSSYRYQFRGWVPPFSENQDFHVGIDTNLGGWVPLFLENWSFQVGIDTKLGGGGVYYFQISKSQVFGPWVGILDPDPPLTFSLILLSKLQQRVVQVDLEARSTEGSEASSKSITEVSTRVNFNTNKFSHT